MIVCLFITPPRNREQIASLQTSYLEPIHNNINVHLMIKMKVTLKDDEGHRRRSKVTKNELVITSRKLLQS